MSLYSTLSSILASFVIDELGLLPFIPEITDLPEQTRQYHPYIVDGPKLGIPSPYLQELLKQSHEAFIALHDNTNDDQLDRASKVMVLLKPDNYTAMNTRKRLVSRGTVPIEQEIDLINLIFTVPKNAKSAVAWHHRQWLFTRKPECLDMEKEITLCTRTATLYPRNYYAWTYRRWLLSQMDDLDSEYKRAREWVELNVGDHSGIHYLAEVVSKQSSQGNISLSDHKDWIEDSILRYPGHEGLWCHRRFLVTLSKGVPMAVHHAFAEKVIKQLKDRTRDCEQGLLDQQEQLALRFGLWLGLFEKQDTDYAERLQQLSSIPMVYNINR